MSESGERTRDELDGGSRRRRGRGFDGRARDAGGDGGYDVMEYGESEGDRARSASDPVRSAQGWVILVTGVHEEAQEDDVYEAFADFGEIKSLHLNLDRRTGFVKGYALIEYGSKDEAQAAIDGMRGESVLDVPVEASWAFVRGRTRDRRD